MQFGPVAPEAVEAVWPHAAPHLSGSFTRRVQAYDLDHLKEYCLSGACQLWVAFDGGRILGAAATLLTEEPLAKTCSIINLGGERLKEWIALLDDKLTEFARENGCQVVEAVTRKGFSRFVPGFEEDGIVYIKAIKDKI